MSLEEIFQVPRVTWVLSVISWHFQRLMVYHDHKNLKEHQLRCGCEMEWWYRLMSLWRSAEQSKILIFLFSPNGPSIWCATYDANTTTSVSSSSITTASDTSDFLSWEYIEQNCICLHMQTCQLSQLLVCRRITAAFPHRIHKFCA